MKRAIASALFLAVISAGVVLSVKSFMDDTYTSSSSEKELSQVNGEDYLELSVNVLSVDPSRREALVRMTLFGEGMWSDEGGSLTENVTIFVPSASSFGPRKPEFTFVKGREPVAFEVVLPLHEGNAAEYPFDSYKVDLYVYAEQTSNSTAEVPNELIPLKVYFKTSVPGYHIDANEDEEVGSIVVKSFITVQRSTPVVAFSVFVGIVMWGLALAVLFLVLTIFFGERKIEMSMCGFMSGLMFAFYGLRNGQPNVPPVGVFSDVASFFWAELIVASCLLVSILMWVFQKTDAHPK